MMDIVCKTGDDRYIGLIQTEPDGPVRIFLMNEAGSFRSVSEVPAAEFGKYFENLLRK